VLLRGFPAGALATNCWVLAADEGERCVVVDPGQDAAGPLGELLTRHRLSPAAVLVTHGHVDHIWDLAAVCATYDVPVWVGAPDRPWLADPAAGLSAQLRPLLAGAAFHEPADVRTCTGGEVVGLAEVGLSVLATPGHTAGSLCFALPSGADGTPPLLFTGDTLFQGSIGRSDLPSGHLPTLMTSLEGLLAGHDDATAVLPGHGAVSTIGDERRTNPFLLGR